MCTLEITQELAKDIFRDEDGTGFDIVKEGSFVSEYKDCSNATYIIKHVESGKYYEFLVTRIGSYYTDYDWEFDLTLREVELKEVMVKRWVKVGLR